MIRHFSQRPEPYCVTIRLDGRVRTWLFLVCVLVGGSSPDRLLAAAPTILRSITLEGAALFTPREILSWLTTQPTRPYFRQALEQDCETIRERYRSRGFLGTSVFPERLDYSSDSVSIDLVMRIEEGKQTVVGTIIIHGETVLTEDELLTGFDTKTGEPLASELLEQDLEGVISRYESLGFPLVSCSIEAMRLRQGDPVDTMEIDVRIVEGGRVTLDLIRIQGNKETDQSVIVREMRLSPGELYNPEKVQAIRRRLIRLNIFSSVDEPQLFLKGPQGGLMINVREGSTNTFDGVVGYVPSGSSGQPGYVTGLVSVAMRNVFGTGRKMSVQWNREDRYSQTLGLRYVEPWIASQPVNVGISFDQRQQDTSYIRRVLELKAELMISDALSISLVAGSESVIPSSDSTITLVSRSSTRTIGTELLYDTRDEIYSPTGGARYHLDYHYGRKKIGATPGIPAGPTDVSVQRLGFDLELYIPTFVRQLVSFAIHGRDLQGGRLEDGEMFRFGGMNTLRGYRENQFTGSRLAWINNEYRFLLGRRTFFFGFLDTGYYSRPADDLRGIAGIEAFRYGYGVGIRLDTALGNLGVSLALGEGDSFSNAKIHFGLINEF